jgi:hypothetical protein
MKKILVILPGASDPYEFSEYKDSYILKDKYNKLYKEALLQNYSQVIVPSYNGQSSKGSSKLLTMESTIKTMLEEINTLEEQQKPYDVLSISYGTFGFIELLKIKKFNYLQKVTLWGAGSCDSYYKNMIIDEKKNTKRLLDSGTIIKEDIFYKIKPFVVSVFELSKIELNFNIVICGGEKDQFYSESLRQSILKISKNPNIILPKRVKDCKHSIDISNKECHKVIFG